MGGQGMGGQGMGGQGTGGQGTGASDREATGDPGLRTSQILRLSASAFVVLAAEPSFVLVDTAVVGHLGPVPLGALGIAGRACRSSPSSTTGPPVGRPVGSAPANGTAPSTKG